MKGQFNKPICAIITSLVLILGTFAIAFPAQEANAGAGLPVKLTVTCKVKGNESLIFGQAGAFFMGEKKANLGFIFTSPCIGDGAMKMVSGAIPPGTEEVRIKVGCFGSEGDTNEAVFEKKFKEGQTSFQVRERCAVNSGSAIAVLTSNF